MRSVTETYGERPAFKSHPGAGVSPVDRKTTFRVGPRAAHDPWWPGLNTTNTSWRFGGRLHPGTLRRAIDEVTQRHGILRSCLVYQDGGWRFSTDGAAAIRVVDLCAGGDQARATAMMREAVYEPFRLDNEGPARVVHVEISDNDHLIGLAIHHAFADADGVRICADEIASLYDAILDNRPLPLPVPPLEYRDYLISLEQWADDSGARPSFSHWSRYLEGARGLRHGVGVDQVVQLEFPLHDSSELRRICAAQAVGPHLVWEAIHHVTLWRFGQLNPMTLTVSRGRREPCLAEVVGNFVDLLPNRTSAAELTFRQLVASLSAARRESSRYYPLSCNLLADRCALEFADVPQFNFSPVALGRIGAGSEYPETVATRMSDCAAIRVPVPWLDDFRERRITVDRLVGAGNPYLSVPYILFVVDRPEFQVTCIGNIGEPFTVTELVEKLESTARQVSRAPDQSLWPIL